MKKPARIFVLLSLCAVTLAAASARADDGNIPSTRSPSELNLLARKVTALLAPYIVLLDRDLVTFRYEARDAKPLRTAQDLKTKFMPQTFRFFDDAQFDSNMAGPGIYAATDPYSTTMFGSADPALYIITLKAGTRLASTAQSVKFEDLRVLREIVKDMRCADASSPATENFGDVIGAFRTSKSADCRKVIVAAVARLDVQAIVYSYDSVNNLANCRYHETAVNIISERAIDWHALALVTNDQLINVPDDLLAHSRSLYAEASHDYTTNKSRVTEDNNKTAPTPLMQNAPAPKDYERWKAEKIYACGKMWSTELLTEVRMNDLLQRIFAGDREIQDAELGLLSAFKTKFNNYHDEHGSALPISAKIDRLNAIETILFANTGLPRAKFENWKKAKDLSNGNTTLSSVQKAESLLGEAVPTRLGVDVQDFRRIARDVLKLARVRGERRSTLATYFHSVGLGPLYSDLFFGGLVDMYGTVVPMSKAAAADVDGLDRRLQLNNRESFKRLLLRCTALYKSAMSASEIAAGPCGMRPSADSKTN